MESNFKREIDALNDVFTFVDNYMQSNGFDDDIAFPIKLAVEELFINLVRHNQGGSDHIQILFTKDADRLTVQLKDFEVEPFDISKIQTTVDVTETLEGRRIGGLGIHLVKSVVDKVTYEYANGTLTVTAIKKLGGQNV